MSTVIKVKQVNEMSLYVTRHGQTNYNVNNLVCGISPAALTTDGIEQAKELGRQLKSIKYDFYMYHRYNVLLILLTMLM